MQSRKIGNIESHSWCWKKPARYGKSSDHIICSSEVLKQILGDRPHVSIFEHNGSGAIDHENFAKLVKSMGINFESKEFLSRIGECLCWTQAMSLPRRI